MEKIEFLRKLEVELKIIKYSPHTLKNYIKSNKKLLEFTKKDPEEITTDDIKTYMAEYLSNKASSSIILFLASLKFAYKNVLNKDLTLNINRPKKEKKIPVVLTKEEVKRLIDSIENKKSKLMVSLMYAAGLRVSELVNLKINALNLDEAIGLVFQGKGRKDRDFRLPSFLINDLKEQIENLPENTKSELLDYFISYRKDKTKEGIIVRDADLLENALEAKEYLDKGLKHAQNWIDNIKKALVTNSAKKILIEIENSDPYEWWQGLKKADR